MKDYELVFVLNPDFGSGEQKKLTVRLSKVIVDLQGKVEKKNEWGKKKLAYPISKKTEGSYFLWELKLLPESLVEIEKRIKLEEGVIRYLLVLKEKEKGKGKGKGEEKEKGKGKGKGEKKEKGKREKKEEKKTRGGVKK